MVHRCTSTGSLAGAAAAAAAAGALAAAFGTVRGRAYAVWSMVRYCLEHRWNMVRQTMDRIRNCGGRASVISGGRCAFRIAVASALKVQCKQSQGWLLDEMQARDLDSK